MRYVDIENVRDAEAWIGEQARVTREELHMLCLEFPADAERLRAFARERDITLTGEPGR